MSKPALFAALLALSASTAQAQSRREPVIDMHLHAYAVDFVAAKTPVCTGDQPATYPPIDPRDDFDPAKMTSCARPMIGAVSDDALMRETLAMLKRYNVRRAVTSGDGLGKVAAWHTASNRIVPAIGFGTEHQLPVAELRRLYAQGAFTVFAEVSTQYRGIPASDPQYEPYWALAEELDIPVGIHLGEGPPAAGRFPGYETYRASLTSAFQLEEVLRRHSRLRIYAMHYGSPKVDDTIAMLFTYPNLYVDVACNDWQNPRAQFYADLKRLIDAGFGQRIMYGSDQMLWPKAIPLSIDTIETAPFLSRAQKRDILYNNAARFLRLSKTEIARDHQP
jgi:predicted TIM-barrel fold metal-dependent hydrolase